MARRCVWLQGSEGDTCAVSLQGISMLRGRPSSVLWVSVSPPPIDDGSLRQAVVHSKPQNVHKLLGKAFDAVVVNMHSWVSADVLGQCHGFVWGEGCLVLRMSEPGRLSGKEALAVHPHSACDVGDRFLAHVRYCLEQDRFGCVLSGFPAGGAALCSHTVQGTKQQSVVIDALSSSFQAAKVNSNPPAAIVVLADRGRGKSSALGLALRRAMQARPELRVAVTSSQVANVQEVFRHAFGLSQVPTEGPVSFIKPVDLALHPRAAGEFDLVIVDEAATVSVPCLQTIVSRHSQSNFAFATTARGYEGTGRGFMLRFLLWLDERATPAEAKQCTGQGAAAQTRPHTVKRMELFEPIRWQAGDPMEALLFDMLLLNAQPSVLSPRGTPSGNDSVIVDRSRIRHVILDKQELADNHELLRAFFGLLVHAHYRTTPGDLQRILDAPNLQPHALVWGSAVVAATLVAVEGSLPPSLIEDVYWGRTRLRGQAVPDCLVAHMGQKHAGALSVIRSVRIAVHPRCRRQGLGTHLVNCIHDSYSPDLFATMFGLTAGLLEFRRQVGYRLVRISASRGTRTGEPSALMIRPVTARANTLCVHLRQRFAADLPVQLALLQADHDLLVDPALQDAMFAGLPQPTAQDPVDREQDVAAYAFGPRTFEAVAVAVRSFVQEHKDSLPSAINDKPALTVLVGRVLECKGWGHVTTEARLKNPRVSMRALRRAVRSVVVAVAGHLIPKHRRTASTPNPSE